MSLQFTCVAMNRCCHSSLNRSYCYHTTYAACSIVHIESLIYRNTQSSHSCLQSTLLLTLLLTLEHLCISQFLSHHWTSWCGARHCTAATSGCPHTIPVGPPTTTLVRGSVLCGSSRQAWHGTSTWLPWGHWRLLPWDLKLPLVCFCLESQHAEDESCQLTI